MYLISTTLACTVIPSSILSSCFLILVALPFILLKLTTMQVQLLGVSFFCNLTGISFSSELHLELGLLRTATANKPDTWSIYKCLKDNGERWTNRRSPLNFSWSEYLCLFRIVHVLVHVDRSWVGLTVHWAHHCKHVHAHIIIKWLCTMDLATKGAEKESHYDRRSCVKSDHSSKMKIFTLRWQSFAGTIFCNFGLNCILRIQKYAIYTQKWYRVDKFECSIVHIAIVSRYKFLRLWVSPQKYQTLVPAKNSHLR